MNVLLILGDQLFSPHVLRHHGILPGKVTVFMREDRELCTHFRYHKQKIVFFLCAMRNYAEELESEGYAVHYQALGADSQPYDAAFLKFLKKKEAKTVFHFEIQDEFFETRIGKLIDGEGLERKCLGTPMFVTTREQFATYLKNTKKPFMKNFYEAQRLRLKVLIEEDGSPVGGRWSFDDENRLKLDASIMPPALPQVPTCSHSSEVRDLVEREFANHPGTASEAWLPSTRADAKAWLRNFLSHRLEFFGPYEDALPTHTPFVYHSVLTPFLNCGLLSPSEVVKEALAHAKIHDIPLNSLEGFVRQVIGWREFVRGIYQNFRERQDNTNFWNHDRCLSEHWYRGDTGIEPLDRTIKKCLKFGYAHHIERLMVVGNLMLLLEIHPREAFRWFMEMFVDSADWVMGPNVYGMTLFSDGGIFATKPYICGSNYYRKMGPFKTGDWQAGVDGLYWGFVAKHQKFFSSNPRMKMMLGSLGRMDEAKIKKLREAADELRMRLTREVQTTAFLSPQID